MNDRITIRTTSIGLMLFGVIAFIIAIAVPGNAYAASSTHVYRLWNSYDGQHLITADENEYQTLQLSGWTAEGNIFNVPTSGDTSIYRLYNPNNGDHFYTSNKGEYDSLCLNGWSGEGPKFKGASENSGIPIYRLWNSAQTANGGLGSHLWTADANEYAVLPKTSSAWRQEDVAWYGLQVPALPSNPSSIDGTKNQIVTLYGTIVREYRGNEIFTSHNGYYYFLKLENPITTKCNVANASKGTTQTKTSKYMQLSGNSDLQSFVGLRVMVTGKMGAYGTGTFEPPYSYQTIKRFD